MVKSRLQTRPAIHCYEPNAIQALSLIGKVKWSSRIVIHINDIVQVI